MLSRKRTSQGKPKMLPATSLWSYCGWWSGKDVLNSSAAEASKCLFVVEGF